MSSSQKNDGDSNVDDLFDSLGLGAGATQTPGPQVEPQETMTQQQPAQVESTRGWPLIAGALGVGLVLAVGLAIWALSTTSSDVDSNATATEGSPAGPTLASLTSEAKRMNDTFYRLGLDDVAAEIHDQQIFLIGTVHTEHDLSVIRNAVILADDPASIDMTRIAVVADEQQAAGVSSVLGHAPALAGGAPPVDYVAPASQLEDSLESELVRILTATPLVFDPGSTELNELQLKVLDTTIVGVLARHPGVPVRLVGHADESGSDYDNALLSFNRATVVSDYLVANGVSEFIVRPEGRGEADASGDAGADRRVDIVVVRQP